MDYMQEYRRWLESPVLTEQERAQLAALESDRAELERRFFAPLSFGTAGLRGIMGMGIRNINVYTVREATEAFARVILEEGEAFSSRGVCVCWDCRIDSGRFAREAARVLAANGLKVWLFADMRPTPELSFAIRHLGACAGINVTASHNPKEYNGYKVYWETGAQIGTELADRIAAHMAQIDVLEGASLCDYDAALADGRITLLGPEMDEAYISAVLKCRVDESLIPAAAAKGFSVAYSPFHGVGAPIMPEVTARSGLPVLHCVPEQMERDGNFPTLRSPNPEDPAGFALAVEVAKARGCHLILGTDPDADRLGVMVRGADGEYRTISANRMGALLAHYILSRKRETGTLPQKPLVVKTIVTTELTRAVATSLGAECADCFTGFKFIAERADRGAAEGRTCVLGYEESIGYMVGDHARDKDGIAAGLLVTEMAAWYFLRGMTLLDAEEALLARYGWHAEKTANIMMPGLEGLRDMAALMARLRQEPPSQLQGYPVLAVRDYLAGTRTTVLGTDRLDMCGSDVLTYELAGGQKVVVRPSGTEPKIKVYALMKGPDRETAEKMAKNFADGAAAMLNIQ